MKSDNIITVSSLKKIFFSKKNNVIAVDSINFAVKRGEIFGLLGTNGAGKSTTLDILTTKSVPTEGDVKINDFDIKKDQNNIRKIIGYVSQKGGADSLFTGYENLILSARLYGMDEDAARDRANYLIDRFFLGDFVKRKVSGYSGGQKRKLELAIGLIHKPEILFLDEPTTGLDPESRSYFWHEVKKLKSEGLTLILTTHYLEEADNLCDTVAIMDKGRILCIDSSENLKKDVGDAYLRIDFLDEAILNEMKEFFAKLNFVKDIVKLKSSLSLYFFENFDISQILLDIFNILHEKKISLSSINLSKPSLDQVFLKKTGKFFENN